MVVHCIPLTKYLNSPDIVKPLREGDKLFYQNVNHPANGPKKEVTFKRYSNTGILVEEFPGTIYSGNLWINVEF